MTAIHTDFRRITVGLFSCGGLAEAERAKYPAPKQSIMMALLDFVVRLVTDVGRFLDVFVNDLILGAGDPLSAVLVVTGQAILLTAVGVFGYAAIGSLLNEIGITLPALGGRGRGE